MLPSLSPCLYIALVQHIYSLMELTGMHLQVPGEPESTFCTGQITPSCGRTTTLTATNCKLKQSDCNGETEKESRLGSGDRLGAHSLTEA